MPYLLEADPADVLQVLDTTFKIEPVASHPGDVTLVFDTEHELDAMCHAMRRRALRFLRIGYRLGTFRAMP